MSQTTPIVIPTKDVPTNPFDPTRGQILLYNNNVDIANAWNLRIALNYSGAMHDYIARRADLGGPPPNMTQPPVPLYRHILADGTALDGPEPVIDPIPLPVIVSPVEGHLPDTSQNPVMDALTQILSGLQTVYPMIQQDNADIAAIRAKLGA